MRVEISMRTVFLTLLMLGAIWLGWIIRELFYALFLAFIFMSALKPLLADIQKKTNWNRSFLSVVLVILVLAILMFLIGFIFPPIIGEFILFVTGLPELIQNSFPSVANNFDVSSLTSLLPNITENIVGIVGGIFSNILFLVSVIFFTIYFLIDEKIFEKLFMTFLPSGQAERLLKVMVHIERRTGAWVRGELILMTVIGLTSYIGLTILGVRYALSLAFLAGILEVVPIIGPIISAIPAILVATSISWLNAGLVMGLYIIIQQLENNLIVPIVMNRAVGLNPLITLISLSVGSKLGGVVGAILAVPITLCIEVVLNELILKKNTGSK